MTVDLGDWTGSPTGYVVTVYRCTDPGNQSTCEASQTQSLRSDDTSTDYMVVPADAGESLDGERHCNERPGLERRHVHGPVRSGRRSAGQHRGADAGGGPYTAGDTIDVTDLGTWTNSPTQYRYYWYTCSDDTSTADCYRNGGAGRWNRVMPCRRIDGGSDANLLYGGGFVRVFVQALNANGFGNAGAFSDAVEVDPAS